MPRRKQAHAGGGHPVETVPTKMEAVRRALDELGRGAMPTAIQEFVKRRFAVDISAKVASIYKSKITTPKGTRGRPGRKPKGAAASVEAAPRAAQDVLSFKDLRAVKDLKDRLGRAGLRQLLELMCP
jgi:hypothetical protein